MLLLLKQRDPVRVGFVGIGVKSSAQGAIP
jgi:hypothetical protein